VVSLARIPSTTTTLVSFLPRARRLATTDSGILESARSRRSSSRPTWTNHILETLTQTGGNKSLARVILGIEALDAGPRKIRRYDLVEERAHNEMIKPRLLARIATKSKKTRKDFVSIADHFIVFLWLLVFLTAKLAP